MTIERILELINAGIDGELNESEASELQQHLDSSEEARSLHAGLHAMTATIAAVPQRDPPEGLRKNILEKVQLPGKRRSTYRLFELSPFAGYGLAIAAGLVMIVSIYQLGPQEPTAEEVSRMTGTIVEQPTVGQAVFLDSFPIKLDLISGKVNLLGGGDTYILEFEVQSSEAMDVVFDLGAGSLQFAGFTETGIDNEDVSVTGSSIRVRLEGDKKFVMSLERIGDDPIHIKTEIYSAGARVHQGTLTTQ